MSLLPDLDRSLFESLLDGLLRERGALTREVALEAMERAAATLGKEKKPRPKKARDASPVVMTFTLRNHLEWGLTEAKMKEWKGSFVGLDVEAELRKAQQYLRDKPTGRPTSQMAAFLNKWLNRAATWAAERGIPRGGVVPSPMRSFKGEDFNALRREMADAKRKSRG